MTAAGLISKATALVALILMAIVAPVASQTAGSKQAVVDDDGVHHLPAFSVPPSEFASEEAKRPVAPISRTLAQSWAAARRAYAAGDVSTTEGMLRFRQVWDAAYKKMADDMLKIFSVVVTPEIIAGVQTDIIIPKDGISAKNKDRVLINLHGGGMFVGARYEGQVESIPIASLGEIKVITVDYRMAPEHRFPAASEDVAKVYTELLKQYRAENIGIYGCSAGGWLTASSVTWFQVHDLPTPGAISVAGIGAADGRGDSSYLAAGFLGLIPSYPPSESERRSKWDWGAAYFGDADPTDPLVFPAAHPDVLRKFPPTLVINSMRDPSMSNAVYTHTQLVKAGVDADLHVWEGMPHCFTYDPTLPESREAYDVLIRFFDRHLGKKKRTL